jgi:restriction endonuclease Mrr
MAKTDNLIHYLSDVANAIREKEGSTDPINAQDFSEHIRAITTESAGDVQYYRIVNGNDPFMEGQSFTFDEYVAELLTYLKILSIRSVQFGQIISDVVKRTGSSDIVGEGTKQDFMSLIAAHDVLGFAIYTGKTAELNV